MAVKHIAFTVYPVRDMARARKFYEGGLGLEAGHDFRGKWIEYYLDNGCFVITSMMEGVAPSASAGGSIALEVDDVDAVCARLKSRGARVKIEPFATPVCRMAVLLDPEGNALTLHKKNPGR